MKRQLALFVAAAMAASMIPAMSVSAWTTNSITTTSVITAKTALFEPGSVTTDTSLSAVPGSVNNDGDVDYTKNGGYLVITPQNSVIAGSMFTVNLSGAKWNFRSTQNNPNVSGQVNTLYSANYNYGATPSLSSATPIGLPANPGSNMGVQNNTIYNTFGYYDNSTSTGSANVGTTFNPVRGAWEVTQKITGIGGNYYRFIQKADKVRTSTGNPIRLEVPYMLTVDTAVPGNATVTILAATATSLPSDARTNMPAHTLDPTNRAVVSYDSSDWDIVIPLAILADNSGNPVSVSVADVNAGVSGQTIAYATISTGATNTTVTNSTNTARSEFSLDAIRVAETQAGSLKSGTFYINAPYGFHWNLSGARVVGDAIFANASVNVGFNDTGTGGTNPLIRGGGTINGKQTVVRVASGMWGLGLGLNGDGQNDSQLLVTLNFPQRTVSAPGSISIVGAKLEADNDTPFNYAINLNVQNIDAGVTNQSAVLAGTRVDWTISLTADTNIPTLIAGRYDVSSNGVKGANYDAYHKAARLTFSENAPLSWWGNRETDFILPDKVKFMEVKFPKLDKISTGAGAPGGNLDLNSIGSDGINNLIYWNVNNSKAAPRTGGDVASGNAGNSQSYANVQLDGKTLKIFNVKVDDNSKATMQIDSWLSVDLGFTGDITISCTGSATGLTDLPNCKVATAVSPVKLDTKVTSTKVGLQYVPTQDITLTENMPGALLQGGKVNKLAVMDPWDNIVADAGSNNYNVYGMYFSGVKYSATPAPSAGGIILENSSGFLFNVKAPSTVASTITLSGIVANVSRSIPESNDSPYAVALTGSAFVNNSEQTLNLAANGNTTVATANGGHSDTGPGLGTDKCDQFATRYIKSPYISITSSASDVATLVGEVRVTIDNKSYTVNGDPYTMDVAPYISKISPGTTMVPLRFISNAFGVDDSSIVYDDNTYTATIITNARIIQVTKGSTFMVINGQKVPMVDANGKSVQCENAPPGRLMVPFRAMGNAFGVRVDWDEATRTAIYNSTSATSTASTSVAPVTDTTSTPDTTGGTTGTTDTTGGTTDTSGGTTSTTDTSGGTTP